MNIKKFFEIYAELITNKLGSEKIFANSGMVNKYKILYYDFFPLGSGI